MTEQRTIDPDALTMDSILAGALRGRPVTVLGFARSGIALARFLADAGARVTVYDGRPAEELAGAIDALEGRDVRLALGPEVDPAATWADAALVTTSPSINPDYPTTEPRLRSALRALVEARAAGDPAAPALVSEPDLFLRLCRAPTVGVTGTKGKTTTASLTAALLAADPGHPAVLGGNIGVPIVERLPELRPGPSGRLRAVGAPAPHAVARHDRGRLHERDRGPHRPARLARRIPPRQAQARRARRSGRGPRAQRRRPGGRVLRRSRDGAGGPLSLRSPDARRAWRRGRLDRRGRRAAAAAGRRRTGGDRAGRQDPAARGAGAPRAGTTSRTPWPRSRSPCCSASRPTRSAAPRPASRGVEHRLEPVAVVDGVRFVNDSQGTQPDAVAAALEAFPRTSRADRRRPRQGNRPDGPCTGRREAGRRCRADRRERARARGPVPRRGAGPHRAGRVARPRRSGAPMRSHATHCGTTPEDRRPCSSARPQRASTCSRTTRPADGPSSRPWPTWPQPAPQEEGTDEPRAAPVAPRRTAPRGGGSPAGTPHPREVDGEEPRRRAPTRTSPARLHDPRRGRQPRLGRHPDGLFVVGDARLPVERQRHVRDRGSPDPVGAARAARDGRDDARRLSLPAARVGAVLRHRGRPAGARLRAVSSTSSSAARRAGCASARCRRSIPPRSRSSRSSSISPTGWRNAARASGASGAGRSRS